MSDSDEEIYNYYTANTSPPSYIYDIDIGNSVIMGCFNSPKFACEVIQSYKNDENNRLYCNIAASSLLYHGIYDNNLLYHFMPSILYYPSLFELNTLIEILNYHPNMHYSVAQAAIIHNRIDIYNMCNINCELALLETAIQYKRIHFYNDLINKGTKSRQCLNIINQNYSVNKETIINMFKHIPFDYEIESQYVFTPLKLINNHTLLNIYHNTINFDDEDDMTIEMNNLFL